MGWGSSGPPPWVDEGTMEEAEKKRKAEECVKKIEALEKENQELKKRVKQLEAQLKKSRKK